MIYHIVKRDAWRVAQRRGIYRPPSLAAEGFIHLSSREQVVAVANDFYRGERDLFLLCIDENRLKAELRREAPAHPQPKSANATAAEALFPHLYGALNLEAVIAVYDFRESADGDFALPGDLR